MMRYLYLLLAFVIFVSLVSYCNRFTRERNAEANLVMLNNFRIKGRILDIKSSGNHNFGILLLEVDSATTGRYVDSPLVKSIYPYKIKNRRAEVYLTIPDGVKKGDQAIVDSDKKTVFYHYKKENIHPESTLLIVQDPYDIEFVLENTIFK